MSVSNLLSPAWHRLRDVLSALVSSFFVCSRRAGAWVEERGPGMTMLVAALAASCLWWCATTASMRRLLLGATVAMWAWSEHHGSPSNSLLTTVVHFGLFWPSLALLVHLLGHTVWGRWVLLPLWTMLLTIVLQSLIGSHLTLTLPLDQLPDAVIQRILLAAAAHLTPAQAALSRGTQLNAWPAEWQCQALCQIRSRRPALVRAAAAGKVQVVQRLLQDAATEQLPVSVTAAAWAAAAMQGHGPVRQLLQASVTDGIHQAVAGLPGTADQVAAATTSILAALPSVHGQLVDLQWPLPPPSHYPETPQYAQLFSSAAATVPPQHLTALDLPGAAQVAPVESLRMAVGMARTNQWAACEQLVRGAAHTLNNMSLVDTVASLVLIRLMQPQLNETVLQPAVHWGVVGVVSSCAQLPLRLDLALRVELTTLAVISGQPATVHCLSQQPCYRLPSPVVWLAKLTALLMIPVLPVAEQFSLCVLDVLLVCLSATWPQTGLWSVWTKVYLGLAMACHLWWLTLLVFCSSGFSSSIGAHFLALRVVAVLWAAMALVVAGVVGFLTSAVCALRSMAGRLA